MRTDAELLEFALTCEKIEKQGGDVLGYIEQEYPSYTPRATWYRLQKACLNRTVAQLTEGKPKEKGVKYMGKMMDLAQGCIEAYRRGESVYDFLASQGIKNPSAYWYQIKQTVKLKDPDLYEQLSVIRTDTRKRPSPTCCQPARESGVSVPDEIPEETKRDDAFKKVAEAMKKVVCTEKTDPEPMEIVGVRSRVKGYYMKAEVNPALADGSSYVHLIWRDLVTREERSIGLSVEEWKQLAEEIPQAMKQLGF